MRPVSIWILTGAVIIAGTALWWNQAERKTTMRDNGRCEETRHQYIQHIISSVFPQNISPVEIISCDSGSTPFASFSHTSAEVTPESVRNMGEFRPLGHPGWIPMSLLGEDYEAAFHSADWNKVTYLEAFDPKSQARIFIINAPDERAFLLITSE